MTKNIFIGKIKELFTLKRKKTDFLFYFQFALIYSAVWLMFAVVIHIIFAREGRTFLWSTDGVYQHYASFQYLCDTLSALFRHSPQALKTLAPLNYTIGQGADLLTTLNSYDFTDPVSIVCALIIPLSRLARYKLMLFIKLWLSGAAFSVYCFSRQRNSRLPVLLGAVAYTFSGAVIFIFARHPNFANWAYFLPLLLAGVEFYRRRRKAWPLILSVFFNLLTNYYTFYITAALSVMYIIVLSGCEWIQKRNSETLKKELLTDLKLAGFFGIGVLLSSAVLFPTAYAFLHNPRVAELTGYRDSMWSYGSGFVRKLIVSALLPYTTAGHYSYLGIFPIAVPGFLIVFFQKKENLSLKVMALLLCVMMCIPLAGRILNGFSYATNRWAFSVVFFFCVILTEAIPLFQTMEGGKKWAVAGLSFAYLAFLFFNFDTFAGSVKYIIMGLLTACILLVCFVPKKRAFWLKSGTIALIGLTAFCNINMTFLPAFINSENEIGVTEDYLGKGVEEFREATAYPTLFEAPNMSLGDVSTPENFFRTECQNRLTNVNGANHVNGTNSFWSLQPNVLGAFYKDMELASVAQNCNFKGLDARTTLLELASVKYYAVFKDQAHAIPYGYTYNEEYSTAKADVYENTFALPIAYTYDRYITREEYEQLNPVQKQEVLRKCAVLEQDAPTLKKVTPDISDVAPLAYKITDLHDVKLTDTTVESLAENAHIRLRADVPENCEVYLRIRGTQSDYPDLLILDVKRENTQADFSFNRKSCITNLNYPWHVDHEGYTYNLGYGGAGHNAITIQLNKAGLLRYEAIELYTVRMDHYEQDMRAFKACPFENAYVDSQRITGDISTQTQRLLQFSVPYSIGFSATIDGEETEVLQSDAMYTAVMVPEGTHHIELTYHTPYLKAGLIVSVLTAGSLIAIAVIRMRKKSREV